MNVVFSFQNRFPPKPQKQNIVFEAGLTPKMMQEIQRANISEISSRLARKGISTDFKENKIIAWCCDKTIQIFEQINQKFKTNLSLPKGIFVEDFESLNVDTPNMYGFCNLQPAKLIKNSDKITPSRVVFFNNFASIQRKLPNEYRWLQNWDYINTIADARYATRESGTDFFLDLFMHELSHVSHEDRLINKFGGQTLAEKIASTKEQQKIQEYQKKYGQRISQICDYALTDQFEAIACDIPRVIANSLDKETLLPIKHPFIGTPYENLSFWQRVNIQDYPDAERPLKEILRNFWNGKFD